MPITNIQIRPGQTFLLPHLELRGATTNGAAAEVVKRDLARYYDALALALTSVELSVGEASLIVDALNGTRIDIQTAQLLAAEIADSLDDELAEKWQVDGPALVAKIEGWNLLQRLAVSDAVERFWSAGNSVEVMSDRLAAVGLLRRA